jgi:hypothetical protein
MKGKNAGKITVKDESGKAFHVFKDDPRWLTNEIWHVTKGMKRGPLSEERKNAIKERDSIGEVNKKRITCLHCGTQGTLGNIARYHNDKCKYK